MPVRQERGLQMGSVSANSTPPDRCKIGNSQHRWDPFRFGSSVPSSHSNTDRCLQKAMSYSPNMKRKQARLSDTAGGPCPQGARALAYAAQLATVASNDTIDPNVINDPDFSDFVSRFLSGTTVSEHAAGYSCVTQPAAQPDQLYLGWNGKVALWSAKSTVNFAAYAGGFSTADHAVYAGICSCRAPRILACSQRMI